MKRNFATLVALIIQIAPSGVDAQNRRVLNPQLLATPSGIVLVWQEKTSRMGSDLMMASISEDC